MGHPQERRLDPVAEGGPVAQVTVAEDSPAARVTAVAGSAEEVTAGSVAASSPTATCHLPFASRLAERCS